MEWRPVLIGATALAIVAGFAWREHNKSTELSRLSDEVRALKQPRKDRSSRQPIPDSLPYRGSTEWGAPEATASAPIAKPEPSPPERTTAHEEGATAPGSASIEHTLAEIDSRFQAESVDTHWARSTAMDIREMVSPLLGANSEVESIDCRSTMCRLRSYQADVDQYRDFAYRVTHSDVCKQCFFTKTGDTNDGRLVQTIYVAREGTTLAGPE